MGERKKRTKENERRNTEETDAAKYNAAGGEGLSRVSIPIRSPSRESNAMQDEQKGEKRPKAEWG